MMKRIVIGCLAVCVVSTLAFGQVSTGVPSVNVVGFHNLQIVGDGGAGTNKYTMLAVPMTKVPAYRGTITTNTTTTITDSDASWADGEFSEGVSDPPKRIEEPGESTFFIEIADTNSAFEGRHMMIETNDTTDLTIKGGLPSDIDEADLCGARYKIVAYNRIRDVLGEPGSQVLWGSNSATYADNVTGWSPAGGGWEQAVYYQIDGQQSSLDNNWVQGSSIANDLVIDRDEGVLIKRIGTQGSTNFMVSGEVSDNMNAVVMDTEGGGYLLLGGMSVVDTPIVDAVLTNVLLAGTGPANADNVYAWDGGWQQAVYYQTNGQQSSLDNHWVQGSIAVDSNFVFESGKGYLFKTATNNAWLRESPLAE